MDITYNEVQALFNALTALQGVRKPSVGKDGELVKDGDNGYLITIEPYDIDYNARLNAALLLKKLKPLLEAFTDTRNDIIKDYTKKHKADELNKDIPFGAKSSVYQEYVSEINSLGKNTVKADIDEVVIKIKDLKIDKNKIDPGVIADLMTVIKLD